MSNVIGRKIKTLRKNRQLTQQELAEKVGVTRSTICNYEIGRRSPNLKELQNVAAAFGVGLDYFGVPVKDEAIDVIVRARKVFNSKKVSRETKEELYKEFMELYFNMKRCENNKHDE